MFGFLKRPKDWKPAQDKYACHDGGFSHWSVEVLMRHGEQAGHQYKSPEPKPDHQPA
jgi:hypothetical protein